MDGGDGSAVLGFGGLEDGVVEVGCDAVRGVCLGGEGDGRVYCFGFFLENVFAFGLFFPDDNGDIGFDDAGFFHCDFLEGVSKEVHVVVADVGDDT